MSPSEVLENWQELRHLFPETVRDEIDEAVGRRQVVTDALQMLKLFENKSEAEQLAAGIIITAEELDRRVREGERPVNIIVKYDDEGYLFLTERHWKIIEEKYM